jgi:hypothetical protein
MSCPECGGKLVGHRTDGEHRLACASCGALVAPPAPATGERAVRPADGELAAVGRALEAARGAIAVAQEAKRAGGHR